MHYMREQKDEYPLYVFDEAILVRVDKMREEYQIPECFWQDLFFLMGKHDRPSYRWFLSPPLLLFSSPITSSSSSRLSSSILASAPLISFHSSLHLPFSSFSTLSHVPQLIPLLGF